MPYIDRRRRLLIDARVHASVSPVHDFQGPGELNYAITRLLTQYVEEKGLSYQSINDVRGALTCAGDEFYRRVAIPYEDRKIAENGDVYG